MEADVDVTKDDLKKRAVLSNADHLSKFLVFCVLLLLSIVILKFRSKATFKIAGDLEIGTDEAWIVVLAFSIAHQVVASYFASSIYDFREKKSYDECKRLFDEITIAGPLLFRGLQPRKLLHPTSRIYVLSPKDPTTWVYFSCAILIPLACISFPTQTSSFSLMEIVIALYLLSSNWLIGSTWAIAVGDLGLKKETSDQELGERKRGIKVKGAMRTDEIKQLFNGMAVGMGLLLFYLSGLILMGIYFYSRYMR